jgi:RNA polymerase sigma factor (sigma-70 family)
VGRKRDGDEAEVCDEELIAAWRAGDAKRGEQLWRRHLRSVQRFFANKVPWTVALDLAQRTIECALRQTEVPRVFRTYILGIARHQLLDYLRGEQRRKRRALDLETFTVDELAPSPDEWVAAKRERRLLLHGLRRLPLALQMVLELYFWEQMPARAIAEVLGIPVGTVKSQLVAGQEKLGKEVRRMAARPELLRTTLDTLEQWVARTQQVTRGGALGVRGEAQGLVAPDDVGFLPSLGGGPAPLGEDEVVP